MIPTIALVATLTAMASPSFTFNAEGGGGEDMVLNPIQPRGISVSETVIQIARDGSVPITPSGTAKEVWSKVHKKMEDSVNLGYTDFTGAVAYVAVTRLEDRVAELEAVQSRVKYAVVVLVIISLVIVILYAASNITRYGLK